MTWRLLFIFPSIRSAIAEPRKYCLKPPKATTTADHLGPHAHAKVVEVRLIILVCSALTMSPRQVTVCAASWNDFVTAQKKEIAQDAFVKKKAMFPGSCHWIRRRLLHRHSQLLAVTSRIGQAWLDPECPVPGSGPYAET